MVLRPLIKPHRILAFKPYTRLVKVLLQRTPDFLAIAIKFKFQFFFLPSLDMGNGFQPRQVRRAKRSRLDAVKNQAVVANQPVNRQKKFTALIELRAAERNRKPDYTWVLRPELL